MRRLVVVFMFIGLLCGGSACSQEQVAMFLHHPVTASQAAAVTQIVEAHQQDRDVLHNQPFLVCTRAHESNTAGGYQAYNPAGPWLGAYQFLQSTWNSAAAHVGRPDLVGRDPRTVSWWDQDQVAWGLYLWQGKAPWVYRC